MGARASKQGKQERMKVSKQARKKARKQARKKNEKKQVIIIIKKMFTCPGKITCLSCFLIPTPRIKYFAVKLMHCACTNQSFICNP